MSERGMHGGASLWSALRNFWRSEHGMPLDEHLRDDAGLPPSGAAFACRPVSPFIGAWLR